VGVVFRVPDDAHAPLAPVNLGIQSGRFRYAPEGLFGGRDGARARFEVNGTRGDPYGLTQLAPGDVVVMDAAGGGGFGDPLERDPALVARDVVEGYVTPERAREDYGVAVDGLTGEVDADETARLRKRT
jgi:N-methylhydantoinase B